jgi:CRISPR system Cascade subunit CasC
VTRTILDVHLLQSVPPSNINRDDTGSPKTAVYGGVRRARVSSQAWKKATRDNFAATVDMNELGIRTKRVVELVAERIEHITGDIGHDGALSAAESVLTAAGITVKEPKGKKDAPPESGYLLFLSAQQIDSLARLAAESVTSGESPDKRQAQDILKGKNSIDLALFGRMVADVADLNVDASCQVAHALSTHAVESEYDYFTAVDDVKAAAADEDAGAGMIGTVEFNSATLYRYATIDIDSLSTNLGDAQATQRAVSAFLTAFIRSMPTGKQNTFANRTLPDGIVISVRDDQPVSYVGAFEEPVVRSEFGGWMRESAAKLAAHAAGLAMAFDATPVATWVVTATAAVDSLATMGETVSLDTAIASATATVGQRLATTDQHPAA